MHALAEKTPEVAFCLPKEGVAAPIDIDLPWYVLQVAHGREVVVTEALSTQGLFGAPPLLGKGRAWAPDEYRYVRASRHCKGRTRPVKARLLPGYVLASVASIGEWRRVRGLETARGERLVWGAILSDGRPAQVPRADMEGLLRLAGAVRPYVTSGEARRRLAAAAEERQRTGSGGMARVHRGVWAGSDVPIAAVTGVDRVRALLPMLGSLRLVEMRVSDFVEDGDEA